MKRVKIILCLMVFTVFLTFSGFDSIKNFIFDYAGLFTKDEVVELERLAKEYADQVELDFVIVTTVDKQGLSAKQYAENFYDEHEFGYEQPFGSAVVLLIDMEDREAYIATQGIAIQYIDDQEIEEILDEIFVYLPDGDYYHSAIAFLSSTTEVASEYISDPANSDNISHWKNNGYTDYSQYYNDHYETGGQYYEEESNPYLQFPFTIIYGVIIGIIFVVIVFLRTRTKMVAGGSTYMDRSHFHINRKEDHFMGTTTIRRKIPKNTGKGGGSGGSFSIGSGGHSHGGGGRSF